MGSLDEFVRAFLLDVFRDGVRLIHSGSQILIHKNALDPDNR